MDPRVGTGDRLSAVSAGLSTALDLDDGPSP
jgi:hypothetical protein